MDIKTRVARAWEALAKYGIHSEEELDEAIKNMKPLNIGCMVSPVNKIIKSEEKQNASDLELGGKEIG